MTIELPFRSAAALAEAVRDREVSSVELLDLYLQRIARYNPQLNAVIALDEEFARERARAADAALARGEHWGLLHGVPMTVKESFDIDGLPTTWGIPEYRDNIAEHNALAVDRFSDAGAVVFGKTNVPKSLADWQSYNEIYGTTNNPWDLSRTPGGSSGGSAAALAAGLTGLEVGSDIGASIRIPAHYCGVFGHKPTYGICPMRGHALPGRYLATDISVIGPLGRSADDLDRALRVMAGPDRLQGPAGRYKPARTRHDSLREFRIAVMLTDPNCPVDQEVVDILQTLADRLGAAGARVSDTARPDFDTRTSHALYVTLLNAAMSGRIPDELYARQLEESVRYDAKDERYYGRMVSANTMRHRDWLVAANERERLRRVWAEFFREWDIVLCPPGASAAFPHDHQGEPFEREILVNGKPEPVVDQLFWAGYAGMVYLPATVAPAGRTRSGLPVGVQLIGPHLEDRTCIHLARLIEQEFGGFVPPPGYDV